MKDGNDGESILNPKTDTHTPFVHLLNHVTLLVQRLPRNQESRLVPASSISQISMFSCARRYPNSKGFVSTAYCLKSDQSMPCQTAKVPSALPHRGTGSDVRALRLPRLGSCIHSSVEAPRSLAHAGEKLMQPEAWAWSTAYGRTSRRAERLRYYS
jgi:hypothetical protein